MKKVTLFTVSVTALTALLAGCRSVPDVTEVSVSNGSTVVNGS